MTKNDEKKTNQQEDVLIDEETDIASEEEQSLETDPAQQELEEAESKYKRALADYQNLEKRMVDEKREWARLANRELLLRILPVFDTLQLATKHSNDETLAVCVSQFLDILKSENVIKIDAIGKKFDASIMEAVGTADGNDGKVIDEVRTGFMIYDKLLRPVQVIVGKENSKN